MKTALFCIAKNEDNYIDEFVDYYLNLGFDDIWIYQNEWRANLKNKSDRIHLVEFDKEAPQQPALNHFVQNHYNEYDWAAFFDIDEFLILKNHSNIKDFLINYSKFPGIAFNMRLFGDSGLDRVENDNYSVINRFTHSDDKLFTLVKLMLNFNIGKNKFYFINPHIVNCNCVDPNLTKVTSNGNFPDNEENEIAELAHFRNKTYEECYNRKFKNTDVMYGYLNKVNDPKSGRINLDVFNAEFKAHNKNQIENLSVIEMKNKMNKHNKIKMFIIYHDNVHIIPDYFNNITIRKSFIQAGAELNKNSFLNLKESYYDNNGEYSISKYNNFIVEQSAIYWIGKNIDKLMTDDEFIMISHYSKSFMISDNLLDENVIFLPIISDNRTAKQRFSQYIKFDELYSIFKQRFLNEFTDAKEDLEIYENGKLSSHFNMFCCSVKAFKKFLCIYYKLIDVICKMIDENIHEKMFKELELMNLSDKKLYDEKRIYAFVLEFMCGYIWWHVSNHYSEPYKVYKSRFFGFDYIKDEIKNRDKSKM